ncbi:M48 family metalloprotease [Candidatus Albibeggiatoa sp. nov. NOAA]|uniref:M48 family metalloprotease n=1 Tax=Candidatus Albibeggiatoa sp. nov. NOAA TaxID=3162724 RepID=UPI0032F7A808|nr:M48 family metalloprotease [Thiotrichaceae bacterium]
MRIFILLLCFWMLPVHSIELPDMGSSADNVLSPIEEQKIAKALLRQLRREADIMDDVEVHNYINSLGQKLVSYSEMSNQPFSFNMINESSINAFAVPGGLICLHSGLMLSARSESEFASVFAHEIAHVTQRHIARKLEATSKTSIPMIAAMLAGVLVGSVTGNVDVAQAGLAVATAGNLQMQINFTRLHEKEADRVGIDLLAKAGFEPRDMPNFFQRIQEESRLYTKPPEFLLTHPMSIDRAAEAMDRAEDHQPAHYRDSIAYHLARAKVLILTTTKPMRKLVEQLENMLAQGRYNNETAVHYGLALALLENRQPEKVQQHIDWLLKNDTDRVMYRILQARLALLQKDLAKTEKIYTQALKIYPNDVQLTLAFSEYLLRHGNQPKLAQQLLAKLDDQPFPRYYRLLAQAYEESGQIAESHLSMSQHYYLLGETRLAVEQLKQARRREGTDYFLASRIEARYKKLNKELREMEKKDEDS